MRICYNINSARDSNRVASTSQMWCVCVCVFGSEESINCWLFADTNVVFGWVIDVNVMFEYISGDELQCPIVCNYFMLTLRLNTKWIQKGVVSVCHTQTRHDATQCIARLRRKIHKTPLSQTTTKRAENEWLGGRFVVGWASRCGTPETYQTRFIASNDANAFLFGWMNECVHASASHIV